MYLLNAINPLLQHWHSFFVMSIDPSNDYDEAASRVTETEGEDDRNYDQEHPHALEPAGYRKEVLTRFASVNSSMGLHVADFAGRSSKQSTLV